MSLFNRNKQEITLNKLISQEYSEKYLDECKDIWKNFVPDTGQSDVLQGELLRMLEKLRWEAQNNGNINWDEDFEYFCFYLRNFLFDQDMFNKREHKQFEIILNHFENCGRYATRYQEGLISDEDFEIDHLAYVNDNLYDIIADAIGYFYKLNPKPIPFKRNNEIQR